MTEQYNEFVLKIPTFDIFNKNDAVKKLGEFLSKLNTHSLDCYKDFFAIKDILQIGTSLIKNYREEKLECVKGLSKDKLKELLEKTEQTGVYTLGWYKKAIDSECDELSEALKNLLDLIEELEWLYEKFGEGEYKDILGLCKCASRAEIAEKGYSLTPGAYVGVAEIEDDGVDFAARMAEIHSELLMLQSESNELIETISKNMKEMGL